jgi:hypothetical protein
VVERVGGGVHATSGCQKPTIRAESHNPGILSVAALYTVLESRPCSLRRLRAAVWDGFWQHMWSSAALATTPVVALSPEVVVVSDQLVPTVDVERQSAGAPRPIEKPDHCRTRLNFVCLHFLLERSCLRRLRHFRSRADPSLYCSSLNGVMLVDGCTCCSGKSVCRSPHL